MGIRLHALTVMLFIKRNSLHGQYLDDMQMLKQKLPETLLDYFTLQIKPTMFIKAVKTLAILDMIFYLPNSTIVDLHCLI